MAKELPYLSSYKNVGELFTRIESAKQPEAFTTRYLSDTIGLKSAGDRQLIPLLKSLGFLDGASRPTSEYGSLKNKSRAATVIAAGIRKAYEPLYAANEKAHLLGAGELRGLVSQVAGSDSGMSSKIAGTFSALAKLGNFTDVADDENEENGSSVPEKETNRLPPVKPNVAGSLRPEFHYNIQVHLPANATEENYLAIFTALRKSFAA